MWNHLDLPSSFRRAANNFDDSGLRLNLVLFEHQRVLQALLLRLGEWFCMVDFEPDVTLLELRSSRRENVHANREIDIILGAVFYFARRRVQ